MTSARVQLGFPLSGRGKKRGIGASTTTTTTTGQVGHVRVCPFVFCARQGERAEFDRNALIDGSDSDLNWLFSAPITYVQDGGCGGSALPNLGRKSHLIRKSDEDGDSSGLGRFFYGRSAPSCFTSNQILQVRPNGDSRDARGKSPFDGRFRIGRCCAALR